MITPEVKDDRITISVPFDEWVENLVKRAASEAVSEHAKNCPYSDEVAANTEFITKVRKFWYIGVGIVVGACNLGTWLIKKVSLGL